MCSRSSAKSERPAPHRYGKSQMRLTPAASARRAAGTGTQPPSATCLRGPRAYAGALSVGRTAATLAANSRRLSRRDSIFLARGRWRSELARRGRSAQRTSSARPVIGSAQRGVWRLDADRRSADRIGADRTRTRPNQTSAVRTSTVPCSSARKQRRPVQPRPRRLSA